MTPAWPSGSAKVLLQPDYPNGQAQCNSGNAPRQRYALHERALPLLATLYRCRSMSPIMGVVRQAPHYAVLDNGPFFNLRRRDRHELDRVAQLLGCQVGGLVPWT